MSIRSVTSSLCNSMKRAASAFQWYFIDKLLDAKLYYDDYMKRSHDERIRRGEIRTSSIRSVLLALTVSDEPGGAFSTKIVPNNAAVFDGNTMYYKFIPHAAMRLTTDVLEVELGEGKGDGNGGASPLVAGHHFLYHVRDDMEHVDIIEMLRDLENSGKQADVLEPLEYTPNERLAEIMNTYSPLLSCCISVNYVRDSVVENVFSGNICSDIRLYCSSHNHIALGHIFAAAYGDRRLNQVLDECFVEGEEAGLIRAIDAAGGEEGSGSGSSDVADGAPILEVDVDIITSKCEVLKSTFYFDRQKQLEKQNRKFDLRDLFKARFHIVEDHRPSASDESTRAAAV
jgi:hypothetical protein